MRLGEAEGGMRVGVVVEKWLQVRHLNMTVDAYNLHLGIRLDDGRD